MVLTIVLHNIRSAYNVGAILRTAEGFGVSEVILSGYTPRVDDARLLPHLREKLNHEIHKTALGAERLVSIYLCDDIMAEFAERKESGWKIVGLENNLETAKPIYSINQPDLKNVLGEKVVLVLGEEVNGIDHTLYDAISAFIEIPMKGEKESFNVSVAAGIAMAYLTIS
ncbi:TrmH family RNA methyltransferase [Candidatus Saccharibacteria bacterium]|nr:TrmH family RNA methyltransferase [Candidatus Saccharibacteria bacterium]